MVISLKGDFIEPLELLIEVILRTVAKGLGRSAPDAVIETWGVSDWLWTGVFVVFVAAAIWFSVWQYKHRKSTK